MFSSSSTQMWRIGGGVAVVALAAGGASGTTPSAATVAQTSAVRPRRWDRFDNYLPSFLRSPQGGRRTADRPAACYWLWLGEFTALAGRARPVGPGRVTADERRRDVVDTDALEPELAARVAAAARA